MKLIINALFPLFELSRANKTLKKKIDNYKPTQENIKCYSAIRRREKNNYFDNLDKKYKETFNTKNRLEDKAKTNVIGLTIAITLISGASGIITTINSKFPISFIQWISFFILLISVIYLIIAGIVAVKVLCDQNQMFFISADALTKKDLDGFLEYNECTTKNEYFNIIRNNLIFSSYACIRNSLICMVAILVLCTIPLHTLVSDKIDKVSISNDYKFVYSSEIVSKEENVDFSNIENLIVKDINNREDIQDEICFVSFDDKLVIKYFIEDGMVTVLTVDIIS